MPKKTPRSIGLDTVIMPDVIAESVVEQAERLANLGLSERDLGYYAGRLVEQAETLYQTNPDFRKKVQAGGNRGRDHLHAFMQHWISSLFIKDTGNRPDVRKALIDSGFSMGSSI